MTASPGGLAPMNSASPFAQPPNAPRRCTTGFVCRKVAPWVSVCGVSARNGVMSSMIQIPRPCVAITRS